MAETWEHRFRFGRAMKGHGWIRDHHRGNSLHHHYYFGAPDTAQVYADVELTSGQREIRLCRLESYSKGGRSLSMVEIEIWNGLKGIGWPEKMARDLTLKAQEIIQTLDIRHQTSEAFGPHGPVVKGDS